MRRALLGLICVFLSSGNALATGQSIAPANVFSMAAPPGKLDHREYHRFLVLPGTGGQWVHQGTIYYGYSGPQLVTTFEVLPEYSISPGGALTREISYSSSGRPVKMTHTDVNTSGTTTWDLSYAGDGTTLSRVDYRAIFGGWESYGYDWANGLAAVSGSHGQLSLQAFSDGWEIIARNSDGGVSYVMEYYTDEYGRMSRVERLSPSFELVHEDGLFYYDDIAYNASHYGWAGPLVKIWGATKREDGLMAEDEYSLYYFTPGESQYNPFDPTDILTLANGAEYGHQALFVARAWGL